jgi:hypothetical protein
MTVSCSSVYLCVAGGSLGVHFTVPPGGHIGIGDIESGSGAPVTSADGGRIWTDRTRSATSSGYVPYVVSASCLPTLSCVSSPYYGTSLLSADGGFRWDAINDQSWAHQANVISCINAAECVSVSTADSGPPDFIWTEDGGRHWAPAHIGPGIVELSQTEWQISEVQCSAQGICIAVGVDSWYPFRGLALVSRDSGRSWIKMQLPTGTGMLTAAACNETSVCIASGQLQTGPGQILSTVTHLN